MASVSEQVLVGQMQMFMGSLSPMPNYAPTFHHRSSGHKKYLKKGYACMRNASVNSMIIFWNLFNKISHLNLYSEHSIY